MIPDIGQVVLDLMLVLFFIALALFLLKKVQSKAAQNNQYIKIINSLSIGPKEKIILLEVNQTYLLVGATANQIDTLYAFDELKPQTANSDQPIRVKTAFLEKLKAFNLNKTASS
jgi:flagellar protein FliO/FliZ